MAIAAPQQRDAGTVRHDQSPVDARLAGLCEVWSSLPEHGIRAILTPLPHIPHLSP
jgi:hypothetical protein